MSLSFGPRRGIYIDLGKETGIGAVNPADAAGYETLDDLYRSLCAMLYNFAPLSGHPGGSISSGRFVACLLYDTLAYDLAHPEREDADIISYAAGHKALGLYAMWALRNEIARIASAPLLPEAASQLRLEDLLGFRRNPTADTPLFKKFQVKALDGHPTPATSFVRLATGASGVGLAGSIGLAIAAADQFGANAPLVHIIEGEGGMTPGRVSEAFAAASAASLKNVVVHIDWNQSSIDSDQVCRTGDTPGDYVQWDPVEFAYLHDWNVILVPDGKDFGQILSAQRRVADLPNAQPTAIVYRTVKGWQYGIGGRKSHGAGHALCSEGFREALKPLGNAALDFPGCKNESQRCQAGKVNEVVEECFWQALSIIRKIVEGNEAFTKTMSKKLVNAGERLTSLARKPRAAAPTVEKVFDLIRSGSLEMPQELNLAPGKPTTLRAHLGQVLNYYNKVSNGAFLTVSADLLGSTSVNLISEGFPKGFYNAVGNPESRTLSIGGICEDAQAGVMAGLSAFGRHIGVCSSYAAFIAVLGQIAGRLHAIGFEAAKNSSRKLFNPLILVCAHSGLKTGEDGPTHADPQALQVLQGGFPDGLSITLTPWDPLEYWILISTALSKHPALICPFATRPTETVPDRKALGLAPVEAAASGVYLLHRSKTGSRGCVVLQGSEVAIEFVSTALPLLQKKGLDVDAYYVSSSELFDLLPAEDKKRIFPEQAAQTAMGITGFTLPTMYRWITSETGRKHTLYPFGKGHFLGSGKAKTVLLEAGLDGQSQSVAVEAYLAEIGAGSGVA